MENLTVPAWQIKDKQWMEARKKEWADIYSHLNCTSLTATEIKTLERYFLKGLKPEKVLLVFKLWFHPDRSEENLMAIRQDVTSSDFHASTIFFNDYVATPWLREAPLMGGAEKQVYELLYGSLKCSESYHFRADQDAWNDREKICASEISPSCLILTIALTAWVSNYKLDDRCAIQYMVEVWYDSLGYVKEKILEKKEDKITLLFKFVWYWKNLKEGLDKKLGLARDMGFYVGHPISPAQLVTVAELYQILEERELPEQVQQMWQAVKAIT